MSLILYSFIRCPFAIRVRMALHERALPFEVREEDLKNLSPELRSLHPEAKVPLLLHEKRVIYDSAIINEYLEEAFPNTVRLMPRETYLRAEVRMWTHWCNQLFKIDVDKFKYGIARFAAEECVASDRKVAAHLKRIDAVLSRSSWLVGEEISLADINVFPFVRQLAKVAPAAPLLAAHPKIVNWLERMTGRESFGKAIAKSTP